MNKKFVYQVGNNKKSYTMMHGQPNIKIYRSCFMFVTMYSFIVYQQVRTSKTVPHQRWATCSTRSRICRTWAMWLHSSCRMPNRRLASSMSSRPSRLGACNSLHLSQSLWQNWPQLFRLLPHRFPYAELTWRRRQASSWTPFWWMFRVASRVAESSFWWGGESKVTSTAFLRIFETVEL